MLMLANAARQAWCAAAFTASEAAAVYGRACHLLLFEPLLLLVLRWFLLAPLMLVLLGLLASVVGSALLLLGVLLRLMAPDAAGTLPLLVLLVRWLLLVPGTASTSAARLP
jgi:hypothetical protein